jgi:glycosyltransferase involved in cell wall biosynthesis
MLYCFGDVNKIRVIYNGIDLKEFDETECFDDTLLDQYNVQKNKFFLYIGRLSSIKGIQYLIEAFKTVQSQHPDLKLVIVGRGDFEQQLRKIAGGNKGIIFTGHIESIRIKKSMYCASIAVILPSSAYEVLPMTILEAMACRKPVIASNVEGNSFIVKHGKNGFLSRPRDSANLAKLMNVLFEDRALGKKMGMLGRQMAEQEFTMEKMVNETLKAYESLLN